VGTRLALERPSKVYLQLSHEFVSQFLKETIFDFLNALKQEIEMPPTKAPLKNGNATKPWVKDALSSELFYGNGKPHWPNATKQSEARRERVKIVRFLLKYAFVKPHLRCIAEKLKYCRANGRCHCALCPKCGRALQRFFVSECKSLFTNESAHVVSIIDSQMSNREELSELSASGLINRVKSILRKGGVKLAAGGIDLSYNQDKIGVFEPHWCAHLWLILPDTNRSLWEPALRKANPPSEAAPRPIKIMKWDGRDEALAYALKTTFKRRVSVHQRSFSSFVPQRNTSEQDLRVAERIPLYEHLASVGLHARVFLLGARPTMTDHGFSILKLDL
jgi:hypothetical protein